MYIGLGQDMQEWPIIRSRELGRRFVQYLVRSTLVLVVKTIKTSLAFAIVWMTLRSIGVRTEYVAIVCGALVLTSVSQYVFADDGFAKVFKEPNDEDPRAVGNPKHWKTNPPWSQ